MIRPSLSNIILYTFIKYIVFYIILMFKDNTFKFLEINSLDTQEDWFYYLWIFLFMPILSIILFAAPLYYSFKVPKASHFVGIILLVLIIECAAYTYLASQADFFNGIILIAISLVLMILLFYKSMNNVFSS